MAKKQIGHLATILSMNTSRFEKGVGAALKRSKALRRGLNAVKRSAVTLSAATVAAGAGLAAWIRPAFEQLDVLKKTSDRLGISAVSLRRLQIAAELGGASSEILSKGLTQLARRTAEAAEGTGEGVAAFEALGINARDLLTIPVDEQFYAVANAMQSLGTASEKTNSAMLLFGRAGADLLNTMAPGSELIKEQTKAIEGLSQAYSDQGLKAIEDANDAWSTFSATLLVVRDLLAGELANVVQALGETLTELVVTADNLGARMAAWIDGAIGKIGKLIKIFNVMLGTFQAVFGTAGAYALTATMPELWKKLFPDQMIAHLPSEYQKSMGEFAGRGGERVERATSGGGGGAGIADRFLEILLRIEGKIANNAPTGGA